MHASKDLLDSLKKTKKREEGKHQFHTETAVARITEPQKGDERSDADDNVQGETRIAKCREIIRTLRRAGGDAASGRGDGQLRWIVPGVAVNAFAGL